VNKQRIVKIRARLMSAFQPEELEIVDESHMHVGHEGARDGKGHFRIRVVSDKFAGLPAIRCHRLIYMAIGDLMDTDIHALSILAKSPPPQKK
jgi:BolA protein